MQQPRRQLPSILIVEDDPDVTVVLSSMLADNPAAECAASVPAALARLGRRPAPDLILLDYLLPGGSCLRVLEAARKLGCAVVFMSGSLDGSYELAAFGYACLRKPFRSAQLFDAIETALQRHNVTGRAHGHS